MKAKITVRIWDSGRAILWLTVAAGQIYSLKKGEWGGGGMISHLCQICFLLRIWKIKNEHF